MTVATAAAATREGFAGGYGGHHVDHDARSGQGGSGAGLVSDASRDASDASEGFGGYYQGQHAGAATKSKIDQSHLGMVSRRDAERRDSFANVYGDRHANQDTHSNLGSNLVGSRDAVSDGIFTEVGPCAAQLHSSQSRLTSTSQGFQNHNSKPPAFIPNLL
jgi:hypothetical protein